MTPFLRIKRIPYEEPYHLNLIFTASNGMQTAGIEIYLKTEDLLTAAKNLIGFPRYDQEVFLWEFGSEYPEDKWAFYFRLNVFQLNHTGLCALQVRFNNNQKIPNREISEFCIEAYPADLDRLGKLFEQFSKLDHTVLDWTVTSGEVRVGP